jgi:hypothetical protein
VGAETEEAAEVERRDWPRVVRGEDQSLQQARLAGIRLYEAYTPAPLQILLNSYLHLSPQPARRVSF